VPRPVDTPFDRHFGLEIVSTGEDQVHASVPVRDEIRQPVGLVHGGFYAALAESMTVAATRAALPDDRVVHAQSAQTSFLRPIMDGTVHAAARARHRGRTTWVWEVEITDDAGRLCSLVRTTLAVRQTVDRRRGR
jgi:1,4-dihydroxy-2-naphthoyl-CoA hydrolase